MKIISTYFPLAEISRISVLSPPSMMKSMVTTAEIAAQAGIKQRAVQKRIKRLGIQAQKVGAAFLLTLNQAEKVRRDIRPVGRPRKSPQQSNGNGHK
jgi:hypothetical protein